MDATLRELSVGNDTLRCVVDENGAGAIILNDQRFTSFPSLLAAVPRLFDPESLAAYCQAALTFAEGFGYRYIADIESFKANYQRRRSSEFFTSLNDAGWGNRTSDFGPFDISLMHEPRVEDGMATFFAEEEHFGTPYIVTVPYPWSAESAGPEFHLLPQVSAASLG